MKSIEKIFEPKLKKIILLPLYGVFIPLLGLPAYDKFSKGVPEWFIKQFNETLLAKGPGGLAGSFYFIALLETLTALCFVLSLIKGEFLPERPRHFLEMSLFLAMTTFAVLGF